MKYPTEIVTSFKDIQDSICFELENYDSSGKFTEDIWQHHTGGGGRTRVFNGIKIEKGGVNFSAIEGTTSEELQRQLRIIESSRFIATGVSIVLHPTNPFVPIIHMNIRYFELENGKYWFGGGIDLTPHYVFKEDAIWFHQELKKICDTFENGSYGKFKKWADDYFYIEHRNETRGIGGIFFDHLTENETNTKEQIFEFVKNIGNLFSKLYITIAQKHINTPFTKKNKEWQYVRRGRYIEFNLVWDRGTKFGLVSGGRTESILMSLPPTAKWFYEYQIKENTAEEISQRYFKKGIDWVST